MRRVVIVGASAAGLATAEALRRFDFDGEIVIVGDEAGPAYDRPPLSKQLLLGEWDEERVKLFPESRVARIGAEFRLSTRAVSIDREDRTVRLHDGDNLAYHELVIATGVRPRSLPGTESAPVHMLRTLTDCRRLGAAIREHKRLVIVGAGFIGLEVAATARKLGADVIVIEPVPTPLANRLGEHTASRLLAVHREAGVDIRCGVGVSAIRVGEHTPEPVVEGVVTADGSIVESPVVLVAIGCVPNVGWLTGSGLDLADGVGCDAYCQAAPHVWAAGDVARWHHPGLGASLRVEHRMNASEQATVVAANIIGQARPFTPVPFFWTDHYDKKIQLAGVMPPGAEERTEIAEPESFVHSFWVDGRLIGVLGWNAAKAMMPLRRALDMTAPVAI
jgi:NADPH-dependent 2,4-dienoyl-CoA reductase/sulfur reductase-like enzyme